MPKKCVIVCKSFRNGHPLTEEDKDAIALNWLRYKESVDGVKYRLLTREESEAYLAEQAVSEAEKAKAERNL